MRFNVSAECDNGRDNFTFEEDHHKIVMTKIIIIKLGEHCPYTRHLNYNAYQCQRFSDCQDVIFLDVNYYLCTTIL